MSDKLQPIFSEFKEVLQQRIEMCKFALSIATDSQQRIDTLLKLVEYSEMGVDDKQMDELFVLLEQSHALEKAMLHFWNTMEESEGQK